jgi:hypothetical protein
VDSGLDLPGFEADVAARGGGVPAAAAPAAAAAAQSAAGRCGWVGGEGLWRLLVVAGVVVTGVLGLAP